MQSCKRNILLQLLPVSVASCYCQANTAGGRQLATLNFLAVENCRKIFFCGKNFVQKWKIRSKLYTKLQRFMHTWNTSVRGLQVGREVFGAGFGAYERRVGDAEVTGRAAGARDVKLVDDVSRTTDVTEVTRHAPTELHPAELRMLHQYDVTPVTTLRVERLDQAVVSRFCKQIKQEAQLSLG